MHTNTEKIDFKSFDFETELAILYSSGTTGKPKCICHRSGGVLIQHMKEHQLHCNIKENDNNDGGPPSGGEFIMALNPEIIGDSSWEKHCEDFFQKLLSIDGVRLPGSRRHKKRSNDEYRSVNAELLSKVKSFL